MDAFIQTLVDRRGALLTALGQHVEISIISLLIAMAIAIPLAIWATHHRRFASVMLQIAGVLQTIPSLALLGLLIPLVGIGTIPAVIALVIYALLPIFQNTYIGIDEIDPSIEEAATAFGMSQMRKLFKVELPMAAPVIISGVRQALVMIIGTATLAALIGAGGLGTFILLGIDRNDTMLTLIGALSSALLAIVLSWLINRLEHVRPRYLIAGLAVLLVGFGGFEGYRIAQQPKDNIVIAGKMGSEPDILINMYKDLIEQDNKRVHVTLKPNFGKTSFLFNALNHNQIDIYPEFSGTVLESLVKNPQSDKGLTATETYTDAKKDLSQQFDLDYLKPMAYNNTFALAIRKSDADKWDVHSISDLKTVESQLKPGMTLEFIDRSDGLPGINKTYGLNLTAKSMEPKLRYEAIHNGDINVVDAYSTDSELRQYDLTVLKDNKHFFPAYQGAPLMKAALAKKYPGIVKSLNQLSGKISEQDMQEMNYEVNVQKKSAKSVAHHYLVTHHLLKEGR
ncbi:ABC transporter permease/substrate-binding protein [Furfurilactobacillus entadae]|uniref:ABC transporter permease/substrate-binding protein n=1 Tax=Furfurilactobacillus entadae TaxID=2922307 RepID=UPI0035E9A58E